MFQNRNITLCTPNEKCTTRLVHDKYKESDELFNYIKQNTKKVVIHKKIDSFPDIIDQKNLYIQWEAFYKSVLLREISRRSYRFGINDYAKNILPFCKLFPEKFTSINHNYIRFCLEECCYCHLKLNNIFDLKLLNILQNRINKSDDKQATNYVCKLITIQIYEKNTTFLKENPSDTDIAELYDIMYKCVIRGLWGRTECFFPNMIPQEENLRLINSFANYIYSEIDSKDILEDIYLVTLCENLCKKKIHKDDYYKYVNIDLHSCMKEFSMNNIKKYVDYFYENNTIVNLSKEQFFPDFNICADNDDISAKRNIINTNFATDRPYVYRRLYMLLYSAGIRQSQNKKIDKISYYSILSGKEYSIDCTKLKIEFVSESDYKKIENNENIENDDIKIDDIKDDEKINANVNEELNNLCDQMEDVVIDEMYFTCECGSNIRNTKQSMNQHLKTKKHNKFIGKV